MCHTPEVLQMLRQLNEISQRVLVKHDAAEGHTSHKDHMSHKGHTSHNSHTSHNHAPLQLEPPALRALCVHARHVCVYVQKHLEANAGNHLHSLLHQGSQQQLNERVRVT